MNVPSFPHFLRGGFLVALTFASHANGATLKSETVLAWNDYLQEVNTLQRRFDPGEIMEALRAGEIVVAPAPGQVPKKVPGGLIHHWIGAGFLANTDIDHVLAVVRDYDHYKNYYRPSVIQSKSIARNGTEDTAWMLFRYKSFFTRTTLEVDYHITNVRLDENRCYRISRTTRVQQVGRYGESGERLLPEGQGNGFAWKLYTITRFERRDDGVYMELEVIELSRRIPVMLRLIVDPIVRSLSRGILYPSIQQTRDAVVRAHDEVLTSRAVRQSGSR